MARRISVLGARVLGQEATRARLQRREHPGIVGEGGERGVNAGRRTGRSSHELAGLASMAGRGGLDRRAVLPDRGAKISVLHRRFFKDIEAAGTTVAAV